MSNLSDFEIKRVLANLKLSDTVNAARCRNCEDVVISLYTHDWVACNCFHSDKNNIHGFFIDGGFSYKHSGGNLNDMEVLNTYGEYLEAVKN